MGKGPSLSATVSPRGGGRSILLIFLTVLGLGSTAFPAVAAALLRVVTTVAPITDMVRRVGGEALHVHGLVPEGVNSHTFQPAPGDVQYLAQADLMVLNGLDLEVPIEKLVHSSGKPGVTVLKLGSVNVTVYTPRRRSTMR